MKRITETAATEALERSEHRCGLVVLELGRCARATPSEHGDPTVPLHHIKYRSHGGGHDTENLLPLCSFHHDLIHETGRVVCEDGKGRRYYQLWVENDLLRHYFWEDIAENMRERAEGLDGSFQANYRRESIARIDMARDLAEMERFSLFSLLNGEPEDADEYCRMVGINSPSTVRAFLAAGSFLLDNPDEYERIMEYNEACEAGKEFTYSMLRESVGTLRRIGDPVMRGAKVTEMMADRMAGHSGTECVDAIRDMSHGGTEYQVSAKLEATGGTVTLVVSARDIEAAKWGFRRKMGLTGPLGDAVKVSEFIECKEV